MIQRKKEHRLRLALEKELLGNTVADLSVQLDKARDTIIAVLEALNPLCPACRAAAERIHVLIKEGTQ